MQELNVRVRHEDSALWATVDEFPGVFATGDDLDELRASLEEGIALWQAKPGEPPAPVTLTDLRLDETPHSHASAVLQPA